MDNDGAKGSGEPKGCATATIATPRRQWQSSVA